MTSEQRLALFDLQGDVVKQIEKLERGMPIALAKARTQLDQIKIRKDYNARLKELKTKCNILSGLIYPESKEAYDRINSELEEAAS